jgi:hypothetical protein
MVVSLRPWRNDYAENTREHGNTVREEQWFYRIRIGFLLLSAILSSLTVLVFLWHMLAPDNWRWI